MTADPINAVVKVCGCGRAFDADTWAQLRPCVSRTCPTGVKVTEVDGVRFVESFKQCECRSTLMLVETVAVAREAA